MKNKIKNLDRDTKQIIVLYTFLALLLGGIYVTYSLYMDNKIFPAQRASAMSVEDRCPEGSYEIGSKNDEPICKLEPTGCPFGDSIPLDSPKCAPPPDIECNADWSKCEPKKVEIIEEEAQPINRFSDDDYANSTQSGK